MITSADVITIIVMGLATFIVFKIVESILEYRRKKRIERRIKQIDEFLIKLTEMCNCDNCRKNRGE